MLKVTMFGYRVSGSGSQRLGFFLLDSGVASSLTPETRHLKPTVVCLPAPAMYVHRGPTDPPSPPDLLPPALLLLPKKPL